MSPVRKGWLRGKVAQGAAKSHNLQRIVLVTFAVAGIFLAFFILDAAFVWKWLSLSASGVNHQTNSDAYLYAYNDIYDGTLLILLSGIVTSFVLQTFRFRQLAVYLMTGALSGLLAVYYFAFEFTQTFWLMGPRPPPPAFTTVVIDVFAKIPPVCTAMVAIGRMSVAFSLASAFIALIGLLCGGLYWLLFVRRSLQGAAQ